MAQICGENDDEAVATANDSPTNWAVRCSVRILNARENGVTVETGMVYINWLTRYRARAAVGGVKRSGYGRELSDLGIKVCEPEAGGGA